MAFAAETHLHADFVSGALQLAGDDGAKLLASRAGQREFGHVGLVDGDEVDLGGLTLRVLATPGHTGEHLSYELLDGRSLLGVFTGGSLIVGGAARTDLAGADLTDVLARAQYRSLRRLITLPDETAGMADTRCRVVLLGSEHQRPDVDHRSGEGDQPAAGNRG